ncbi:helix-turn-helix transcriptional regulator [Methylotenera versatilis]|uniref:helix-turn-helix transcriptional regulator n=1 Tax=Methylotenera versatilis TaxID=1055487 RepID=UPI000646FEBF|nr:AlpA family phage regulatory protein [Methylotenera versatilis]
MAIIIQRLSKAKENLGISRSTFYAQISQGFITKPIHIGIRAVGWPSHEIEAIINARIAGKTDIEIKALVVNLHFQRTGKLEC